MKDEYVIINAEAIQQRIAELEWSLSNIPESYIPKHEAQIYALKQILSQSTPLIPEIEKAMDYEYKLRSEYLTYGITHKSREKFISNLKLDI